MAGVMSLSSITSVHSRHPVAVRRASFKARNNSHNSNMRVNGASDEKDEAGRAEERFVSVSELLAEVRSILDSVVANAAQPEGLLMAILRSGSMTCIGQGSRRRLCV